MDSLNGPKSTMLCLLFDNRQQASSKMKPRQLFGRLVGKYHLILVYWLGLLIIPDDALIVRNAPSVLTPLDLSL